MSTQPLVSVLVNCYNGAEYLKEALDSIYAQTYQNFEIIFWDNCSTDNSAAIAKSYDHRLKYFKGETLVPLYSARNLAMKHINGEFLGILDCDDIWLPTKLEKQLPLFKDPEVALVYCDTYFFNKTGIIRQYYKSQNHYIGNCFQELFTDYFLNLEAVLIRMSAMNKLDYYFDGRFNMIGDTDLFRRLAYNWKFDWVEEPLSMWRVHENNLSFTQPYNFVSETEQAIETYKKIFPTIEKDYPKAIWALKKDVALTKAKFLWKDHKIKEARKVLRPFITNLKGFIFYISTFLPYAQVLPLLQKLKRYYEKSREKISIIWS